MLVELRTRTVLVVAAHPDDETIGAGGLLAEMQDAVVAHVTDGSPRNPADALAAGCRSAADYAALRRAEMLAALALAGIGSERTRALGLCDQEVTAQATEAARRIGALLREVRPAVVLTHAYEGGHPDHDAAALAVHAACALVEDPPRVAEFAGYHGLRGWMEPGDFLPGGPEAVALLLSPEARRRKQAMLERYASQRETLRIFSPAVERFRYAPHYCFTAPPHPGVLNYERYPWGVTGAGFRELARASLAELGLEDGL